MSVAMLHGVFSGGAVPRPSARRKFLLAGGSPISRQALATDPVGTFSLTLNNVVVGSRVRVEVQSTGAELYSTDAVSSTVVIPLQAYAPGSPNNDLRVKVRKGSSAPFYQPYETLTTAEVGASSIYVSQIPDA